MLKRTIQQKGITLVNTYAPNIVAPKFVKQILMDIKGEINRNTFIVGDFNTPLTSMDRTSRQKIIKETAALNDTLDQMHLTDFFGGFHPKAAECIFLLSAHRTFSRIHHVLGHKKSLNKFKEIVITSSIFSDHNAMKLEINTQEEH